MAKFVLLKKADKPTDEPTAYRPICFLDAEGKLYEQLLNIRLKSELQLTGGLSDRKFSFREGRQAVDTVGEVIRIARQARKDVCYSNTRRQKCFELCILANHTGETLTEKQTQRSHSDYQIIIIKENDCSRSRNRRCHKGN